MLPRLRYSGRGLFTLLANLRSRRSQYIKQIWLVSLDNIDSAQRRQPYGDTSLLFIIALTSLLRRHQQPCGICEVTELKMLLGGCVV